MKTHLEFNVRDVMAICDLAEAHIIASTHQNPNAYREQDAIIRGLRHEIAEANRIDPKQKEMKLGRQRTVPTARKQNPRGPKRNVGANDAPVLVGRKQRSAVRESGKR